MKRRFWRGFCRKDKEPENGLRPVRGGGFFTRSGFCDTPAVYIQVKFLRVISIANHKKNDPDKEKYEAAAITNLRKRQGGGFPLQNGKNGEFCKTYRFFLSVLVYFGEKAAILPRWQKTADGSGGEDMNLNQLYYFKTLAELEHYTKAAERLNISQPTLSHSISSMEKELGAHLFEKQGRNVVLTKYGRIYMFYVENALTQLELGKNQIERLVSEGGGHVGLAYMTSVGANFVPNIIAGFLEDPQNKNISFSCYEGNTKTLLYNLKREKYDLIFCSMIEAESDVEFIPVYEQSLVVIVPEGHPLANKKKVTIQDICPYPLISYTKESGMRRIIDDMFTKAQIMPNILCQFEDVNSMAGLVAANQGLAIVTDGPALDHYHVEKLELDMPYSRRMVYLAYVLNRYLPPAVEKFIAYIIQHTKEKK